MAFGTGLHETTSLCIKQLEEIDLKNKKVLDIGCGSGILSVVAAKLNAEEVFATDIDPLAIEATIENSKLNNIKNIDAVEGSLLDKVTKKYDVIIANILLNVLHDLIPDLKKALNNNGVFICSGLLKSQQNEIEKVLYACNFTVEKFDEKGEWISIVSRFKNV